MLKKLGATTLTLAALAGGLAGCSANNVKAAPEVSTSSTTATPEATGESSSADTSSNTPSGEKSTTPAPDTPTPTAGKSSEAAPTGSIEIDNDSVEKPKNAISLTEAFNSVFISGPTEQEVHDKHGNDLNSYLKEVAYAHYVAAVKAPFVKSSVTGMGSVQVSHPYGENPVGNDLDLMTAEQLFHAAHIPLVMALATAEGDKDIDYHELKAGYPLDSAVAQKIASFAGNTSIRGIYNINDYVKNKEDPIGDATASHEWVRRNINTVLQSSNVSSLELNETGFSFGAKFNIVIDGVTYDARDVTYKDSSGTKRQMSILYAPVVFDEQHKPIWPGGESPYRVTGVPGWDAKSLDYPKLDASGQPVTQSGGRVMMPLVIAGQGYGSPL